MNESPGDALTELLSNGLDLNDIDETDLTEDADGDEEPEIRSSREGLPSSFRMRHDAHYVDELMSRTPFVPAALEREIMPRAHPTPDAPPSRPGPHQSPSPQPVAPGPSAAAANLALVASRLESVLGHADGVRAEQGASSLLANSVRVEFGRVARLARAAVVLEQRAAPTRRDVSASQIADRVRRTSGPVARMAGFDFSLTLGDAAFTVPVEAGQVVQAISGTVDALVDLVLSDARHACLDDEDASAVRMSIALHSVKIRPALIVEINCPALAITDAHAVRFFDSAADEYQAVASAGALLAAAAHITRAHGGRADIKRQAGVTITYVFPQMIAEQPAS